MPKSYLRYSLDLLNARAVDSDPQPGPPEPRVLEMIHEDTEDRTMDSVPRG